MMQVRSQDMGDGVVICGRFDFPPNRAGADGELNVR